MAPPFSCVWISREPPYFIPIGNHREPRALHESIPAIFTKTSDFIPRGVSKAVVIICFGVSVSAGILHSQFDNYLYLWRIEYVLNAYELYQMCGRICTEKIRYIVLIFRDFRSYRKAGRMGFKRPWVRLSPLGPNKGRRGQLKEPRNESFAVLFLCLCHKRTFMELTLNAFFARVLNTYWITQNSPVFKWLFLHQWYMVFAFFPCFCLGKIENFIEQLLCIRHNAFTDAIQCRQNFNIAWFKLVKKVLKLTVQRWKRGDPSGREIRTPSCALRTPESRRWAAMRI